MMAKRWARALLLIFSWGWLTIGVFDLGMTAFVLPQSLRTINSTGSAGHPEISATASSIVIVITIIVLCVIFVILPGAWVLFYGSRHVKATCEARDPVIRWTDRCPLPVIAASLWQAWSAAMILVFAVVYKVLPVFGMFVVGPLASALSILIGLLLGYSAWALYVSSTYAAGGSS